MRYIEFWPDYNAGPLWSDQGVPIDLSNLGIPRELAVQLHDWNAKYEDLRLPLNGPGDTAWLRTGAELLRQVRAALGSDLEVLATEPWWSDITD